METVNNLKEAIDWFIANPYGTCLCVDGERSKECSSYAQATKFYYVPSEEE